jgi:hypothetical protein
MLITSLAEIRDHKPCRDSWRKLLAYMGKTQEDDEPLSFETILESNGLMDALWVLRVIQLKFAPAIRLLVCDLVETALPFTTDPRPAEALHVARAYARGKAPKGEWAAARDAAWAAARAAQRARLDAMLLAAKEAQ